MGSTFATLVKELILAAQREGMEVEIRLRGGKAKGPVARSFEEAERMGMFGPRKGDDGPSGGGCGVAVWK